MGREAAGAWTRSFARVRLDTRAGSGGTKLPEGRAHERPTRVIGLRASSDAAVSGSSQAAQSSVAGRGWARSGVRRMRLAASLGSCSARTIEPSSCLPARPPVVIVTLPPPTWHCMHAIPRASSLAGCLPDRVLVLPPAPCSLPSHDTDPLLSTCRSPIPSRPFKLTIDNRLSLQNERHDLHPRVWSDHRKQNQCTGKHQSQGKFCRRLCRRVSFLRSFSTICIDSYQRTAQGITAPPAVVKEADKISEELSALGNSIDSRGHPVGRYHSCTSRDTF